MTLLVLCVTGAWAYDGASGDVSFFKINGGGKANKMATGCYYYRPSSGYSWSDGNGVKTQSNTSSVIFYIDKTTDVTVDIKHTESKNAHTVTASVYSLEESAYSAFSSITSETAVTFSLPTSVSTSFNINIAASTETFTGTKQLTAGYYAIVCTGDSNDKGKAFFNAIHFAAVDSRPAAPISWSEASALATIGESNTFPTLTNTNGLTVSYSSSNTGVATINATTGAITLVAKGETTISATYTTTGSSDTYKTTKVSYVLTVSNISAVSEKFWKFSDAAWSSYTQSASPQTIDNMYIISNSASDLPVQDCETSYSDESLNFTKHLYTSGSSTDSRRVLNICVAPNSKISVYAAASGTGSRSLYISNGSYNNTSDQSEQATSSTTIFKLSHVNVAGGDVFIHNTNGYYIYGIKVEPLKCGTPTFSPNGGSIEEGGSVTITSTDAATIKYAWTADDVDTPNSWTSAAATDDAIVVTVPNTADNTPRLHAYGIKSGYTDGDAAYVDFTITGVDTTAPTLTAQSVEDGATDVAVAGNVTLTFDENVQVADASKVTLTGGEATISTVTAEDNVVTIAYTGLENYTTYTLEVENGAITDVAAAQNAYAGTSFSFTTVKTPMPAPKINGLGYFIGSQTVSITSDVEGAAITYSLDGENYSAYTTPFEISADKTVYAKATHADYAGEGSAQLAMYIITVPSEQENVTETTTWDFTDSDDMEISSNATNEPIPTIELLKNVTAYSEIGKAAQLSFIMPQRYDKEGYVQAHGFVITATVPGTLSVEFTNGNDNLRYLIVNGVKEGQINSRSSHPNVNDIEIPVGTTIVYGFDVSGNAVNNLRYEKITFAVPTTVSVTISSAKYATFSSTYKLDFTDVEGLTVYKATATGETSVTLDEVTGIVPANTGLLLNAEAGTYYIPVSTADATANVDYNLLQSTASAAYNVTGSEDGTAYVFGSLNGNVGFYKAAAGKTIGVGKSWLLVSGTGAKEVDFLSLGFGDDETTGIGELKVSSIEELKSAPMYNLAGQKVSESYKGIVIVNGKKYVRK